MGVEISVGALRLCQQNAPGVPLVLATGEALPFGDAGFDLVTCLGSLEHFPSPGLGLREIARILRASGSGLVAVPNRRFIGWRLLRRRGTEQQAVAETLFDRDEWYELMGAAGLEVVRVAKEPWHTKPYRSWGRRLLLRWAWRLIPLRWTYQFAFICRRAVGSASGVQEGQGGAGGAGGA